MEQKLLEAALNALNQIPNMALHGDYPNSYALASAISKHLREQKQAGAPT